MDKLQFKIIGEPVAKGRPRFFRTPKYVGTYTPKNTRQWEEFVRHQALKYRPEVLWEGPIMMTLGFMMPRPKSMPKKVIYHTKKPDVDNLAKSIKDALQGIIYKTDSQIISLTVSKRYSPREYGVEVKLEHIE